jgi:orotidine-5'-phosphate decarboxylase
METSKASDSRVIVALDTPDLDTVTKLIKDLEGIITYYKIGFELFTAHGWKAVDLVRRSGAEIFLDLKYHDIPNTVAKTAAVVCEHDLSMFNVHTLGGLEMMSEVRKVVDDRAKDKAKKPKVLGVTILTSHNEETLKELGIERNVNDQVLHLARLAKQAGLDGVVASPHETELLRKEFKKDFLIVTPGIRPAGSAKGDQKRTFGPKEALEAGASYIVVGRPITAAIDPRNEAIAIVGSIK